MPIFFDFLMLNCDVRTPSENASLAIAVHMSLQEMRQGPFFRPKSFLVSQHFIYKVSEVLRCSYFLVFGECGFSPFPTIHAFLPVDLVVIVNFKGLLSSANPKHNIARAQLSASCVLAPFALEIQDAVVDIGGGFTVLQIDAIDLHTVSENV